MARKITFELYESRPPVAKIECHVIKEGGELPPLDDDLIQFVYVEPDTGKPEHRRFLFRVRPKLYEPEMRFASMPAYWEGWRRED